MTQALCEHSSHVSSKVWILQLSNLHFDDLTTLMLSFWKTVTSAQSTTVPDINPIKNDQEYFLPSFLSDKPLMYTVALLVDDISWISSLVLTSYTLTRMGNLDQVIFNNMLPHSFHKLITNIVIKHCYQTSWSSPGVCNILCNILGKWVWEICWRGWCVEFVQIFYVIFTSWVEVVKNADSAKKSAGTRKI